MKATDAQPSMSHRTRRFRKGLTQVNWRSFGGAIIILSLQKAKRLTMYALILVVAVLSPATASVTPVGVTSHVVGKFKTLDQCKAAASEPGAGGAISDLSLSRGVYWYCVYMGTE